MNIGEIRHDKTGVKHYGLVSKNLAEDTIKEQVCMYVCIYLSVYVCMHLSIYLCMYVNIRIIYLCMLIYVE